MLRNKIKIFVCIFLLDYICNLGDKSKLRREKKFVVGYVVF